MAAECLSSEASNANLKRESVWKSVALVSTVRLDSVFGAM